MEARLLKKYPALDIAKFEYVRLRSKGKKIEEALEELTKAEDRLLPDYEVKLLNRIGISDAMAERRELTDSMAASLRCAVDEFLRLHPRMETTMHRLRDQILQSEHFGPPAVYPPWEEYSPHWEAGDVFACPLSGYFARLFHLEGKLLLLYVYGERRGEAEYNEELVYLSLCEENSLPRNIDELNALGYLPAFTVFREYQYLHALRLSREEELTPLKLRKLGNFPGSLRLFRERPDPEWNAQIIVPAYKGKDLIVLERSVCVSYQHFGSISNAEQANLAKKSANYGLECRLERGEAPTSVIVEKTRVEHLSFRTYFSHITKLPTQIPRHDTMLAED